MKTRNSIILKPLALLVLLALGMPAESATPDPERIARKVDAALPPVIRSDNTELVNLLLTPKISNLAFNPDVAVRALFGDAQPGFASDCKRKLTAQGDPDQGDCVAGVGKETGEKAYQRLSFSKTPGVGNVSYMYRPPVTKTTPEQLTPVRMTNDGAFKLIFDKILVGSLGLPPDEVPIPPDGFKVNPYISDQAIGFSGKVPAVVVRKIVVLPRGLPLSKPIVDQDSGRSLDFIPAPGMAMGVVEADGSVSMAKIQNWVELRINEKLDPRMAKSRQQLIDEIGEELLKEGGGTIRSLTAHIAYDVDWRGSFGYLVPAVRISVAPLTGDATANGLQEMVKANAPTAGFVKSFPLVEISEDAVPGR